MAKEKIVVIDDSPIVRKLAELALEEEGYKVYTAEDGEEGLRICEEVRPAVILVDFIMPRISGYQFCEAARENELLKDIPIILITGKGEDVGKKFAEKFGVGDYFIKPFKSEVLVEKVNAIIYAQKERAGKETLEEAPAVAEADSAEPALSELYEEKSSFYGKPSEIEEKEFVEPAYEPVGLNISAAAHDELKFGVEELTPISSEASLEKAETESQEMETVGAQPEQVLSASVEQEDSHSTSFEAGLDAEPSFAEQEPPIVKFEETSAMADFAYPPSNEMLVEPEPLTGSAMNYQYGAAFGAADAFMPPPSVESVEEKTKGVGYDITTASLDSIDKLFRRYLDEELPYLMEQNIEDVLRRHGVIKDTSIVFSGDLGSVCGLEAMKLAAAQKLTGKFSAFSRIGSAEIYFDKGEVVCALSSKQGSALTAKRVAMIRKGSMGETEGHALSVIIEAVMAVADFRDGNFFFEKMEPPKTLLDFGFRSNVTSLVLQGLREKTIVAEQDALFSESDIPVRAVSDNFARNAGMNSQEIEVFLSIDGASSVLDISRSGNLDISDISGILSRLYKAGIVDKKGTF